MRTWFFAVAISLAVIIPWSSACARDKHDEGKANETRQTEKDTKAQETASRVQPSASKRENSSFAGAFSRMNLPPAADKTRQQATPEPSRPTGSSHPSASDSNRWGSERHPAPVADRPDSTPARRPDSRPDRDYRPDRDSSPARDYHPDRDRRPDGHDNDYRRPPARHDEVIIIRDNHRYRPRFRTDPVVVLAGLVIAGCIIANADRPASPPLDPIAYARRNGTYFSCREECLANFKANFFGRYTNDFACAPSVRPAYIPKETYFDGRTVYVVYCPQYHAYGFWDPANPESWITYSVWDDDTMVDQLMLRSYYLYPTS